MSLNAAAIFDPQTKRRALFLGANLAFLLVVYLVAVEPLLGLLGEGSQALAERRATLAGYESIAAQEQAVKDYARQVEESNSRGELLTGESEGVVNANLQARLKALAGEAGATVVSLQALPAKVVSGQSLVGARLDVTGPLEALSQLARSLESDPPLLLVLAASVRKQSGAWSDPAEGAAAGAGDNTLEGQFDVFGGASKDHS
ncbi:MULTISPECIES: type II secretion system protein GspM [Methylosinus]|uniref:General secretion pathway protein GspM n=1 Tax=Methylosinus trichosporium (strain ATCC 35070 / NCIMB 11131 / UNIQEM 75 / OB3b) TaxID=595536 RepID=A0A2D2CV01_METT3|nr:MULTISPECIES: type II secretion system protein GspM [Methylosinus]ATQ66525.1 general secretion pathway protein GspM [Methylosinus trichosporium OB3b]OBS52636.1 general secretion pathway protein GspM [Methylosinus sp. 3S-1]